MVLQEAERGLLYTHWQLSFTSEASESKFYYFDKDEYELALQQQLQLNIPIASIRALLETRTDTSFTYDQINAICTKAQSTNFGAW